MNPFLGPPPRGAVQLLLVSTLVGLAALVSALAGRSVFTDMLNRHAWGLAQQSRLAAQAALATAQAELLARYASESDPMARLPNRTCPSTLPAPRWQCLTLPLSDEALGQTPHRWTLQAWLARDLVQSPHVLQLQANAQGTDGAQTQQSNSLLAPHLAPAPSMSPNAAVVLGQSAAPDEPPPKPCAREAWRQVFGKISPEQLQAWSQAQARNGLDAQSQPPRSIWWIDSPADWNTSLDNAQQPVLVVFSAQACATRCPRIATSARIHGTVYLDASCDDDKVRGWQSGPISGQLVVESGLSTLRSSPQVTAKPSVRQAYALSWPPGADSTRLQSWPGSHWEGP